MIKNFTTKHATYTEEQFIEHVNKDASVIIEAGSRDLLDALYLEQYFPKANIYSFECNEDSWSICENNLNKSEGRIHLSKCALYNKNENISFYAFEHDKTEEHDIGVSSIYKHNNPASVPQKNVTVKGIRLDTFCEQNAIKYIDYLCLDVQGAEKVVLEGLGDFLNKVGFLVLEDDAFQYQQCESVGIDLLKNFEQITSICHDTLYRRTPSLKKIS